ncbi:MAG: hypothetical protein GZ086_13395 [Gelidibacter sp.]|nr:hypothetical protein [Gelidibacter sp.]
MKRHFYAISLVKREHKLPNIPILLDKPMGVNATEVYFKYRKLHKLSDEDIKNMLSTVHLISEINASKIIIIVNNKDPKIVLADSGMITGGRVLHYLNNLIIDEKKQRFNRRISSRRNPRKSVACW